MTELWPEDGATNITRHGAEMEYHVVYMLQNYVPLNMARSGRIYLGMKAYTRLATLGD